jgi:hypothetical protein
MKLAGELQLWLNQVDLVPLARETFNLLRRKSSFNKSRSELTSLRLDTIEKSPRKKQQPKFSIKNSKSFKKSKKPKESMRNKSINNVMKTFIKN